jgi:hypothetical protein
MADTSNTGNAGASLGLLGGNSKAGMDIDSAPILPLPGSRDFQSITTTNQDLGPSPFGFTDSSANPQEYMLIRIPGRGPSGGMLTYRWLINPKSIRTNYKTLDAQTMTRSGFQYGVWGDDLIEIAMEGQSAGYYFSQGLTDIWKDYTISYRNLLLMQTIVLNNGCWFEGEELGLNNDGLNSTTLIKCHQDVQLIYHNFIWSGMFTNMTIESGADHPFFDKFSLTFVAWKERYRSSSPWRDSIHNKVQRGHVYKIWDHNYDSNTGSSSNNGSASNAPALGAVSNV